MKKLTQAEYLPIDKLKPFEGHLFYVKDDDDMMELLESIRLQGLLTPLVVRPINNNEYEVISGHRRLHACKKAGIEMIPAFIYSMDRNEAVVAMVDSNLHREMLLPSEKAFAYKMKMDALTHQGQACGQVGHKSRDTISETESGRQIQRYMLYAKRNFFEYFFHLYNNFFFKHKLPPFIPYRCFSSIYPLFCSPIQSASWDGAFHPASPEYPSCFPAAAAPQYDLL